MKKIIIGQEAICPDGLGRVTNFTCENYSTSSMVPIEFNYQTITVETYVDNRSCDWAASNVELIYPRK